MRLDGLGTSLLLASSSPAFGLAVRSCSYSRTFACCFFQPGPHGIGLAVQLPLPPSVRSGSFHPDSSCPCRAHGQAGFGPTVSAVLWGEWRLVLQIKEGLELTNDLTAGGRGIKALPEHAPEGALAGVVTVAAVLVSGGLGEEIGGHPRGKTGFQLAEGKGAHGTDEFGGTGAHRIEAVRPRGKEGGLRHRAVYIPPY